MVVPWSRFFRDPAGVRGAGRPGAAGAGVQPPGAPAAARLVRGGGHRRGGLDDGHVAGRGLRRARRSLLGADGHRHRPAHPGGGRGRRLPGHLAWTRCPSATARRHLPGRGRPGAGGAGAASRACVSSSTICWVTTLAPRGGHRGRLRPGAGAQRADLLRSAPAGKGAGPAGGGAARRAGRWCWARWRRCPIRWPRGSSPTPGIDPVIYGIFAAKAS